MRRCGGGRSIDATPDRVTRRSIKTEFDPIQFDSIPFDSPRTAPTHAAIESFIPITFIIISLEDLVPVAVLSLQPSNGSARLGSTWERAWGGSD